MTLQPHNSPGENTLIMFMKRLFKAEYWLFLNLPALLSFIYLSLFPAQYKLIITPAGYSAAALLLSVLLLNPLISAFPTQVWLKKLNHHRRIIGVAVVSYAFVHISAFFAKRSSLEEFLRYLLHPIILPGLLAFLICLVLAITSNKTSIKKLGFLKWKKLHNKVYIAQWAVFIHMFLQGSMVRLYGIIGITVLSIFQILRRYKRSKRQMK